MLAVILQNVPQAYAVDTLTWYMRGNQHTINTVTGYMLKNSQTAYNDSDSTGLSGNWVVNHGIRIYYVRINGTETEITVGTPVAQVTRNVNGEGLQSATYDIASSLIPFQSALIIRVYRQIGGAAWSLRAIFISNILTYKNITASTWTVNYYTLRDYDGATTSGEFMWGSSNYNSRITNIQFETYTRRENLMEHLKNGDLIGFVLYAYTSLIGTELTYGLIFLLVGLPLCIRYQSIMPMVILFLMTGSIWVSLQPTAGLNLGWVLLILGISGVLYRLFRH